MADKLARVERYVVTAPYVLLPQPGHGGVAVVGLHEGAVAVGETIPDATLIRHLDGGMLEPFEMAGETRLAQAADPTPFEMPAANAPHQAWVDYAVTRGGWSPGDAQGASRDELAAHFGVLDPDDPGPTAFIRPNAVDDSSPAAYPGSQPRTMAVGGELFATDVDMPMPRGNASRAAWVDYAVTQGMDREEAEALERNELRERFGSKTED